MYQTQSRAAPQPGTAPVVPRQPGSPARPAPPGPAAPYAAVVVTVTTQLIEAATRYRALLDDPLLHDPGRTTPADHRRHLLHAARLTAATARTAELNDRLRAHLAGPATPHVGIRRLSAAIRRLARLVDHADGRSSDGWPGADLAPADWERLRTLGAADADRDLLKAAKTRLEHLDEAYACAARTIDRARALLSYIESCFPAGPPVPWTRSTAAQAHHSIRTAIRTIETALDAAGPRPDPAQLPPGHPVGNAKSVITCPHG